MTDHVQYEVRGRTALLTIDRPEARNAITGEVADAIEAALDRFEGDDEVWTGVLTGAGPVFCAGADLKEFASGRDRLMFTKKGGFAGIVRRPRVKPLIAACDGAALAGGFEIALACDLIVASTAARFGLPEVKRSLVPSAGGLVRLPAVIPERVAMQMILTGDPLDAATAHGWGLVTELCEPGETVDRALALADRINQNAPVAVRVCREIVSLHGDRTSDELWHLAFDALNAMLKTDDAKEGTRAFIEKRPPVWTGR